MFVDATSCFHQLYGMTHLVSSSLSFDRKDVHLSCSFGNQPTSLEPQPVFVRSNLSVYLQLQLLADHESLIKHKQLLCPAIHRMLVHLFVPLCTHVCLALTVLAVTPLATLFCLYALFHKPWPLLCAGLEAIPRLCKNCQNRQRFLPNIWEQRSITTLVWKALFLSVFFTSINLESVHVASDTVCQIPQLYPHCVGFVGRYWRNDNLPLNLIMLSSIVAFSFGIKLYGNFLSK